MLDETVLDGTVLLGTVLDGTVLLGTVAIEPNRWGMAEPGGHPMIRVSHWLDQIEEAGFDGIELWEGHARAVSDGEAQLLAESSPPVAIFNTYVNWDDTDDTERSEAAGWVERLGAGAVKFNLGPRTDSIGAYTERLAAFERSVPDGVRLLCECHAGTVAEDPALASKLFDEVAESDRLGAIVHLHPPAETGDDPHAEVLAAALDHLDHRVAHVHVQCHEVAAEESSEELADRLAAPHGLIRSAAHRPLSWTVEFTSGVSGWTGVVDPEHDRPGRVLEAARRDLGALRQLNARP